MRPHPAQPSLVQKRRSMKLVHCSRSKTLFFCKRSEQSEVPECLLNCCDFFLRARILVVGRAWRSEPEQLFAMCNPGTLGHQAVLARNPFLDLLIRCALTGGLVVVWRT